MLQLERQKNIMDYLHHHHSATIRELARAVYTSEASVRRDLARLEAGGHVERIYGGVLLAGNKNNVLPLNVRETANAAGKEIVAQKAAQLVKDSDTIILDASSTAYRICHHIRDRKHLRVITNNLKVCQALADCEDIQVYCTGGTFVGHSSCFLGTNAENFIRGVNADILFFSSQAISATGIITDVGEADISMRKVMLSHAKRRVFLCDSSKFGITRPFTLCCKDDVDDIICDVDLTFAQ